MTKMEFEQKLREDIGLVEFDVFYFDEVTNDYHLFVWIDTKEEFVINRNIKLIENLENYASFSEEDFCYNIKLQDFPTMKLDIYRKNGKLEVKCDEDLSDNLRHAFYQILKIFFERKLKEF